MEYEEYFRGIKAEIARVYDIASKARARGFDPVSEVEALPAGDVAARVEGRVGPPGIAAKIRLVGRENITQIVDSILDGEFGMTIEERITQAVRTALDILTEGVVAASMDGISGTRVRENPDGSRYLSIYFSGPIRSAGGTGQGMAVLIGDYVRKRIGLSEYRPTKDEVERYVEEIKTYNDRVARLQYTPSDDDVRKIIEHTPVCIDGEPTEEREVSLHRDLPRVDTNRIRGGMCLVAAEGIAQKSAKLMKRAQKMGLDWNWLSGLGGVGKHADDESDEDAPVAKFMDEVVGGRPIFAAPSAKGAFRLRYGKSRANGIAGKSIHPATMVLTGEFIATGTQVKVERPGKGCVITECDEIDGPLVRLDGGSVVRVDSVGMAKEVKDKVSEILFLGDILVSYGDFLQTNTNLLPAGYCEEWWKADALEAGVDFNGVPSPEEAVDISIKHDIPLHPKYTYCFRDLGKSELRDLVAWILTGSVGDNLVLSGGNSRCKRLLECLGVPHDVVGDEVLVGESLPLLVSLGITLGEDGRLNGERIIKAMSESVEGEGALEIVRNSSFVRIMDKVGTYIGCRMGRPEKAKERRMQPAVHSLFPIGDAGGRERSINKALSQRIISVEVARFRCVKCGAEGASQKCRECGGDTQLVRTCQNCGILSRNEKCPKCGGRTRFYKKSDVDLSELWAKAVARVGRSTDVKGVAGMISEYKIPEPLEKGLLRALNDLYIFKDGTIRFDATDAPLTHFKPKEVGVSIEGLKRLGYTADFEGVPLSGQDQVLELKVQDVVIPLEGAKYMLRVAKFVDELLERFYGLPPYYKAERIEDLLGQLIAGLAPHTSAAITGRIVGFTRAHVCFAHPFWHAAKRRNCDGDEDSFMLLLEVLLNFSRRYLPEKRGGQMDAPMVVTTILNPLEIDDEAHKMEMVRQYGREFYDSTLLGVNPSQVNVPTVSSILAENPYSEVKFTHSTGDITGPVIQSEYVKLGTMFEKVEAQLAVAEKIRAIDEREVAELVINSHFLRDTYGNLRAFSRQHFRCVKCNENFRRVPLSGKCPKCGGRIILTVTEGNIRKYLETSQNIAVKYGLSDYLKGRLELLDKNISSLFTNDLNKQVSLSDFM